jgi:CRP-like cAMP-binding protein
MALNDVIRAHDFTRGLTEAQIESLAAEAREVSFSEGEIILEEGARSREFYLVTEGSVVVELRTPRVVISVQAVQAGQAFGWSSLLDKQDTMFQVRAREHTHALRWDGAVLKLLCQNDPVLGTELLQRTLALVAGRVKATELRFAEMCGVRV